MEVTGDWVEVAWVKTEGVLDSASQVRRNEPEEKEGNEEDRGRIAVSPTQV